MWLCESDSDTQTQILNPKYKMASSDDRNRNSNGTRYFFTKFKLPDSERTVKKYYKFVKGSSGRDKSVWVSQKEAESNGAVERGGVRTMQASKQSERLDTSQYVGYVFETVKTKSKTGKTRLMTQAVGRDGLYYKANEDEATESGLPVMHKLEGLQKWYIRKGRKSKYSYIKKLQDQFYEQHKARAKQRREGSLSYDKNTYTLGKSDNLLTVEQLEQMENHGTTKPKVVVDDRRRSTEQRVSIIVADIDVESDDGIESDEQDRRLNQLLTRRRQKIKFVAEEEDEDDGSDDDDSDDTLLRVRRYLPPPRPSYR